MIRLQRVEKNVFFNADTLEHLENLLARLITRKKQRIKKGVHYLKSMKKYSDMQGAYLEQQELRRLRALQH